MELTDQQLSSLITYLKYYGTIPFPVKFVPGYKIDKTFWNKPEGVLLTAGFLSMDVTPPQGLFDEPSEEIKAGGLCLGECIVYLQVTEAGKQHVKRLGQTDPSRLASLNMRLYYLDQATDHIKTLSIKELPPFMTSELSVIREAAFERYEALANGTDQQ